MQLSLFSECQSKLQICSSERNIRLLPVGLGKDNLENMLVSIQRKFAYKIPLWYLYTYNVTLRYHKVSVEQKLLLQVPFFKKIGI